MCAMNTAVKSTLKMFFAMGTANSVTVYSQKHLDALDICRNSTQKLHKMMSAFDPSSEVSNINANAGLKAVTVSSDLFYLINRCIGYSEKTGGRFDITSGPAAMLWKKAIKSGVLPNKEEIKKAASRIGYRNIITEENPQRIGLNHKGQTIDLGGIGKGYAADQTKIILCEHGVDNALINLGGTVIVLGKPQKVGIRDPFSKDGRAFGSLEISNKAVVTSGYYEQCTLIGGKLYHHIIDPVSGVPSEPLFAGITLVGDSAEQLDAYSTALFCMTAKEAFGFVRENGIDAVFVTHDRNILITDGIKENYSTL